MNDGSDGPSDPGDEGRLTDERVAAWRTLFPVLGRYTYLNHAGVAPCSTRVRDAVAEWTADVCEHGVLHEEAWEERAALARARFARLVGASADEIAFVRSTSHGLGLIAEGLDWQRGDRVAVAAAVEYPSNVYPWQHLAARGVEIAPIEAPEGAVVPAAVARALDSGGPVRVVAVSSAQYASGAVTDLEAIGALCRERGVLLCVDGIQTLGAVPMRAKDWGVHFVAADSHKWLLGISGIGALFVDRAHVGALRPVLVGWKSTKGAFDFDRARFDLRDDALKLEEGSPAYALLYGFERALSLLEEVGVGAIAARVAALVQALAERLTGLGCGVGPAAPLRRHILTFTHERLDPARIFEDLAAQSIIVSVRRGRVRVSPHFYNTREEVLRVADRVEHLLAS